MSSKLEFVCYHLGDLNIVTRNFSILAPHKRHLFQLRIVHANRHVYEIHIYVSIDKYYLYVKLRNVVING